MKHSALLLVFVSPPGSGKTYFSTRFAESNDFTRIGSDTVREEMFTHPDYSLKERQLVYKKMNQVIEENLQQGNNIILDGNLLTNNDRHKIFKHFKEYGKVVFLTLDSDFDYTLQRAIEIGNPLDPHHGEHIRAMYRAFEPLDAGLPSIAIKPGTYETMEKQLKQELQRLS
jgi:predicted kinase